MLKLLKDKWVYIFLIFILLLLNIKLLMEKNIQKNDENCWLWVLDSNGNGFGDIIQHCYAIKQNCESSNHNISCIWKENKLIDSNGNLLKTIQGCECRVD